MKWNANFMNANFIPVIITYLITKKNPRIKYRYFQSLGQKETTFYDFLTFNWKLKR